MELDEAERSRPLSAVLRDICDDGDEQVTLGEIVHRFGPRAFGALLFVIAIPNLLPLPPGSTTVLGMPIMILSPQLAIGVRRPWLPRWLDHKPIRREYLRRAIERVDPTLRRIERVSAPRLPWVFGPVGERLAGLACTALALVLILPIPLGNILPSVTIGLFGLALVQKDGLLALAAWLLTAISAGVLVIGFGAAWLALKTVLQFLGWL